MAFSSLPSSGVVKGVCAQQLLRMEGEGVLPLHRGSSVHALWPHHKAGSSLRCNVSVGTQRHGTRLTTFRLRPRRSHLWAARRILVVLIEELTLTLHQVRRVKWQLEFAGHWAREGSIEVVWTLLHLCLYWVVVEQQREHVNTPYYLICYCRQESNSV